MAVINPYLHFDGNCEEAFNFYKSLFGGDFATVMRFSEMPAGSPVPKGEENKVLHVTLPIGGGSVLMGSDTMTGFGPPFNAGNNFAVAIGPESQEESQRVFDGLAEAERLQCRSPNRSGARCSEWLPTNSALPGW